MAFEFAFDPVNNCVRWSLEGRITDEVFAEGVQRMTKALANMSPKSGLVDLSRVTSFEASTETLRRFADTDPVLPIETERVVVAPAGHVYGVARMFAGLTAHKRPNLEVVQTMEEAYQFLGIHAPDFRALDVKDESGT